MANDSNIYITITDAPYPQVEGSGTQTAAAGEAEAAVSAGSDKKATSSTNFAKHQVFSFIEAQAKQIINYSIQNIGNFTGNYQTQRQINEVVNIGGRLKNVGMAAIAGATMGGGPVGAVVAAAISIASMAVGDILQYNSLTIQTQQQNREISILKHISGLDALNNGSRWGA